MTCTCVNCFCQWRGAELHNCREQSDESLQVWHERQWFTSCFLPNSQCCSYFKHEHDRVPKHTQAVLFLTIWPLTGGPDDVLFGWECKVSNQTPAVLLSFLKELWVSAVLKALLYQTWISSVLRINLLMPLSLSDWWQGIRRTDHNLIALNLLLCHLCHFIPWLLGSVMKVVHIIQPDMINV